jgi:glutaredoxin
MTTLDDLILYELPGCPFCAKVDRFLKENDLEVERRMITEGTNREDLIAIGGKKQCPCLIIDGKALYESDDIIDYLRTRVQGEVKEADFSDLKNACPVPWAQG